ncbi:hypothetical protein [Bacteroides intestinalis]|uniref:hypothetical protein n=1 Tax=Bacteroides intestinalis TaxID=329854 RepID=UPI001E3C7996|nr:hypothetical protein [Bacteroides intestinalis]
MIAVPSLISGVGKATAVALPAFPKSLGNWSLGNFPVRLIPKRLKSLSPSPSTKSNDFTDAGRGGNIKEKIASPDSGIQNSWPNSMPTPCRTW